MNEKFRYVKEFENRLEGLEYCEKKGVKVENVRDYRKDDVLYFSSRIKNEKSRILSNMYGCKLYWNGLVFNSNEQAVHYFCSMEYPENQKLIMNCKDAFEIKRLCKNLPLDSDYEKKVYKVLEYCMRLKYRDCEEFRKILIESGDVELVEYAEWGDVVWGCCKYNRGGEDWLIGQNACGRIMMKVREDMKCEKDVIMEDNKKWEKLCVRSVEYELYKLTENKSLVIKGEVEDFCKYFDRMYCCNVRYFNDKVYVEITYYPLCKMEIFNSIIPLERGINPINVKLGEDEKEKIDMLYCDWENWLITEKYVDY